MLRNYLVTALRNLRKNRLYSFITIGGLAVGLAACLMILLFVRDELSYDRWIPNAERISKLEVTFDVPGRDAPIPFGKAPGPAAPALARDHSTDIEHATRIYRVDDLVRAGDKRFDEEILYVEANFFEVFDLPVARGERQRAVADNTSVAISQKMAAKYFGTQDPIGQVINFGRDVDYSVVAVLEELPRNTHFDIHFIALLDPARYLESPWVLQQWTSSNIHTYILYRDQGARQRVDADLEAFVARNAEINLPGFDDVDVTKLIVFNTIPLLDIHLYARKDGYLKPGGDIVTVVTIAAIAALILLIACVNFVNLATARSMARAREVSLRKVVGATRKQLIGQFLGESCLTALFALVIALGLVELALGPYGAFIDKDLALDVVGDPVIGLAMVGLVAVVGLLGGLYPAFYLSKFRPAQVLKANQSGASGSSFVRNALVVFQFAVSIALIVSSAAAYAQTSYARNLDLGFERENRVVLRGLFELPGEDGTAQATLKREIEALAGVEHTTLTSDSPPFRSDSNGLLFPTPTPGEVKYIVETVRIDADYFAAMGIEPVAGRLYSKELATDARNVPEDETQEGTQTLVVNEVASRLLGFSRPQDAIGKEFWALWDFKTGRTIRTTIIGVVPDAQFRSASVEIRPLMFQYHPVEEPTFGDLIVALDPNQREQTYAAIESVWTRVAPEVPVRTVWIDEALARQYDTVERRGHMFGLFALLAVLIACLGLFGLASFAAEKRTKEIGVRKALGAGVLDIVRLLMWQFSKPVLIANAIAWPVAYWLISRWLETFAFRIELSSPLVLLGLFGGAGVVALFIAWATVAGHAARVASASPVHALRFE